MFLAAPGDEDAQVELTHNWDPEPYPGGRNFGHLAYAVDDIYATCRRLMEHGVTINRPPRDGRMAFVRSPDNISIELLQKGAALDRRRSLGPPCPMSAPGSRPPRFRTFPTRPGALISTWVREGMWSPVIMSA